MRIAIDEIMRLALYSFLLLNLAACQAVQAAQQWHWERAEAGLPHEMIVLAVAADPLDPARLWAGFYGPGGLAASDDGGQSWTIGAAGLQDNPIFELLAIPAEDGAIKKTELWAAARDGVFWSDDAGKSWRRVAEGLPPAAVFALAADAGGRLYLGLDGAGVYAETQTKTGWEWLTPAEPLASAGVLSLAVSSDGRRLYVGTSERGLFASPDGGRNWQAAYPGEYVANLVIDPSDPNIAVASLRERLVRTQDGGQSWQTLATPWGREWVVSLLWLADGALGAGTAKGQLYRSLDKGDSWVGGKTNLPPHGVMDLAETPAPDGSGRLLAGSWTGLYSSYDGGRNWQGLTPAIGNPYPEALLATESRLFLGAWTGLFYWQPETRSWSLASAALPSGVASLAADPAKPDLLYAGTTGDGVYRSDDGGRSWQPLPSLKKGIPAITVDPQETDNIYILAAWERVYESKDGGQSWGAHWAGLGEVLEAVSLAVDPFEPIAYTGTEMGLYRRYNDDDWELTAPDLADQSILALLAQPRQSFLGAGSILYLGTTRGVYHSLDHGATVQGGGLDWGVGLENISVTALLVDPEDTQTLYAGTAFAGVYQSTDGGRNWQPIGPAELADSIVESLAWGPGGELFVAATNGIWSGERR